MTMQNITVFNKNWSNYCRLARVYKEGHGNV